MALVDELNIYIKAGAGGHGVVRWLHEKGKEFMGPAGGNGGKGGDVYAIGISDLSKLAHYRHKKEFAAERGGDGESRSKHGKDGADLLIEVPVGSQLTNLMTEKKFEVKEVGEKVLILKGGRGGLGNEYFKASTNVKPREHTDGKEGEAADFIIELLISASVGLIGLPNAGKSSLLNALTNADAKVGEYQFTTLEPNLGAMYGIIIADIPGLIEGASEGKGLGHKFLRHIKRTKILFHCLSLENEDLDEAYTIIRKELQDFDPEVAKKPEYIIFTKSDSVTKEVGEEKMAKFLSEHDIKNKHFVISIYDDAAIKELSKFIISVVPKE